MDLLPQGLGHMVGKPMVLFFFFNSQNENSLIFPSIVEVLHTHGKKKNANNTEVYQKESKIPRETFSYPKNTRDGSLGFYAISGPTLLFRFKVPYFGTYFKALNTYTHMYTHILS